MNTAKNLNVIFNNFMAWEYSNGIFYITGRDIICLITGAAFMLVIWLTIAAVNANRNKED